MNTMAFRVKPNIKNVLNELSENFNETKTSLIEKAILSYAANSKKEIHPYMKYAGVLSDKEGENMINTIRKNRKNRSRPIKL